MNLRWLLKAGLGYVPFLAEAYQALRDDGALPAGGYALERLTDHLPNWVGVASRSRATRSAPSPKRILVFAYLQWWLEHAVALSLFLSSRGHRVDLRYLPYRRWQVDSNRFDVRRQIAFLGRALQPLGQLLSVAPLRGRERLPDSLKQQMVEQSRLDVQYTLQREELDWKTDQHARDLFSLRGARNASAAQAAHRLLSERRYDTVIIPNGSILEFGAVYRTARHHSLRTITYEFGEQRQRMWLAQDAEVMRLPTDDLWMAQSDVPPSPADLERISELYEARVGGRRWSQFARQWQRSDRAGAESARTRLGLAADKRMVLLCTNVVGDSLALNRQIFTDGMAGWLRETVRFFSSHPDVQLVVRVHPGELLGAGHPSVQIVRDSLPEPTDRIRVIPPDSEVNTYDLIELADFGLVYTSTVGLEMAMYGVPVVVSGSTHYRGKGFTHDPQSLSEYLERIGELLSRPAGAGLPEEQVKRAWHYASLFFFQFPFEYPWHLIGFWDDMQRMPFDQVVEQGDFDRTLRALSGEPIDWSTANRVKLERVQV